MRQIPKPHEFYKHFKGNMYQIFAVAEHSETGEQLVVYQALYGDYKLYARPLAMFMEKVDKIKYPNAEQEYRFELQGTSTNEIKVVVEQAEVVATESVQQEEQEELQLDPMVMDFLDADTYEERLNILVGLRHRITDDMITTMAIALDVEVPEGEKEARYEGLKSCLVTLEKYECNRLR